MGKHHVVFDGPAKGVYASWSQAFNAMKIDGKPYYKFGSYPSEDLAHTALEAHDKFYGCTKTISRERRKEKKQKWYVIFRGWDTGIVTSWDVCRHMVVKYKSAEFLSYDSEAEATHAWETYCMTGVIVKPERKNRTRSID